MIENLPAEKVPATPLPEGTVLGHFELARGVTVRYREPTRPESRWRPARAWAAEPDGSLCVVDDHTGAKRSVRPELVEVQRVGPRGGRRWAPLTSDRRAS